MRVFVKRGRKKRGDCVLQIAYFFAQMPCVLIGFICAAPVVADVCNNKVCFLHHPFVATGYGEFWRYVFKRRIDDVIVSHFLVIQIIFLVFGAYVRSYKYQLYVWVCCLEFFTAFVSKCIESTVFAEKKFSAAINDQFM